MSAVCSRRRCTVRSVVVCWRLLWHLCTACCRPLDLLLHYAGYCRLPALLSVHNATCCRWCCCTVLLVLLPMLAPIAVLLRVSARRLRRALRPDPIGPDRPDPPPDIDCLPAAYRLLAAPARPRAARTLPAVVECQGAGRGGAGRGGAGPRASRALRRGQPCVATRGGGDRSALCRWPVLPTYR